jgi:hypothetical protein
VPMVLRLTWKSRRGRCRCRACGGRGSWPGSGSVSVIFWRKMPPRVPGRRSAPPSPPTWASADPPSTAPSLPTPPTDGGPRAQATQPNAGRNPHLRLLRATLHLVARTRVGGLHDRGQRSAGTAMNSCAFRDAEQTWFRPATRPHASARRSLAANRQAPAVRGHPARPAPDGSRLPEQAGPRGTTTHAVF